MSFTSFQNYLSNSYDDSNENNWFSGNNMWGQFVNIELQFVTQIRDTVSSLNKSIKSTSIDEIPRVKSIPRIKSTKTLDLESNSVTSLKVKENTNAKYAYFAVTGALFCVYLYINTHL